MDIQRQKKSEITAALLTLIRSVWGGFFYLYDAARITIL